VVALIAATAVFADGPEPMPATGRTGAGDEQSIGHVEKATRLIGEEIRNNRDRTIGRVEEIVFDLASGRVLYAAVSAGDFTGMTGRVAAIPAGAFKRPSGQWRVDADKQKLLDAPQYSNAADRQPEMRGRDFIRKVHEHFEQNVWWEGEDSAGQFANARKAGGLKGTEVVDRSGRKIGDIEEVLIDLAAGRVVFVVLSPDRAAGLGSGQLYALPPGTLAAGGKNLVATIDQKKLASAPHFPGDKWPDLSEPGLASRIYRHYGRQAYFDQRLQPTSEDRGDSKGRIYHEPGEP